MTKSTATFKLNVVAAPADELSAALLSLPADTWSGNLAKNTYFSIVERNKDDTDFGTYYAAEGQASVWVAASNPWAYSSGCYVPESKAYVFTGGGHDDWLGSEVGIFDCPTLTWSRTDESAKLIGGSSDDSSAPFNSTDNMGYRTRRNPSGRFAPISSHMYGGMVHLPSLGKIHVHGGAAYRGGNGGPGGATFIDAVTGHWDESGASTASAGGTDCMAVRVPTVTVVDSTLAPTGETLPDCVLRVSGFSSSEGYLVDPVNKTSQKVAGFWSAAGQRTCGGCVAPDPVHAGRLAYVLDRDATTLAVLHRIDLLRNDGNANGNIESLAYGNTKPAALAAGEQSRWIYMGDFVPGCTKIAVYKGGVGLYALDTTDWTWSDLLVAAPSGVTHADGVWKRFEFFSDYDCFGLWSATGDALHVLKRPAVFE